MRITIIGQDSIHPKAKSKNIEDLKAEDFIDSFDFSNLIIAQKDGEIRIMKSTGFPFRHALWDYEQIFRLLYVYMEQNHHIDLRRSIIEMVRHLDKYELTKLLVDIEKLGFERT